MIILIIIYIASIIGAIISIRYDDDFFDEKPWTLFFLVFCPVVNTDIIILELITQLTLLLNIVIHLNLAEKFYKLIRLGRK